MALARSFLVLLLLASPLAAQQKQETAFDICLRTSLWQYCENAIADKTLSPEQRAKAQAALDQGRASSRSSLWFLLISIGLIIAAIFGFKAMRRSAIRADFAALPVDGPMQVNIEEKYR